MRFVFWWQVYGAYWCFLYGGWAGGWARGYGSVGVEVDRTSDMTITKLHILVIVSGIALLALPYMQDIVGIFRLLWVVYTNAWTDGW